jgi:rhodanese-related sulfurtransferase
MEWVVPDSLSFYRADGNSKLIAIRKETNSQRLELSTYPIAMYDYEITVQDAAALLQEGKSKLIDVREPWEYATAKVEGSLPMPMGDVPSRAHQELDPDDRLLILCHHGARSLSVTNWLRQQGFDAAQSVAGGIDAWSCEVDPQIPRY